MTYQHIYLAPHYDDASLSCGGAIHRQTKAGEPVLVVTIFAAPPPPNEPFSPFAQEMHAIWGNPADIIATRQAEDQTSMEILGADYVRLKFTDCIYRGRPQRGAWYYNNNDQLFGRVHPDDMPLADDLVAAIREVAPVADDTQVYAPLTVGNHVDHQLVYAAAWQLHRQGWAIAFYEDYPYADPNYAPHDRQQNPHGLEATLARLQPLQFWPRMRHFSEEDLQAKIDSIAAYASQMNMLFRQRVNMEKWVTDYALHVGSGSPAERLWIPAKA